MYLQPDCLLFWGTQSSKSLIGVIIEKDCVQMVVLSPLQAVRLHARHLEMTSGCSMNIHWLGSTFHFACIIKFFKIEKLFRKSDSVESGKLANT